MATTTTTYDGLHHATARCQPQGKTVAIECTTVDDRKQFSPTQLLEAALGGCMLVAMGTWAERHPEIDLTGAEVDVSFSRVEKPSLRYGAADIVLRMPHPYPHRARTALKRIAETCLVKRCLSDSIPITLRFQYPT